MDTIQLRVGKIPITILAKTQLLFVSNERAADWRAHGVIALKILGEKHAFIGYEGLEQDRIGMDALMRNKWGLQLGTTIDVQPIYASPLGENKSKERWEKETFLFYNMWLAEKFMMFPELHPDEAEKLLLDEKYDDWVDPHNPYVPYFLKLRQSLREEGKEK